MMLKLLICSLILICVTGTYDQIFYHDLCSHSYLRTKVSWSDLSSACPRETQLKSYHSAGREIFDIFPSAAEFRIFCTVRCKGHFIDFGICRLCTRKIRRSDSNNILKRTKIWCNAYKKSVQRKKTVF